MTRKTNYMLLAGLIIAASYAAYVKLTNVQAKMAYCSYQQPLMAIVDDIEEALDEGKIDLAKRKLQRLRAHVESSGAEHLDLGNAAEEILEMEEE